MPVTKLNPTTPAQRGMTTQDFDGITTKKPLRSLIVIKKSQAGRNNQGRITTRHRGGGARRFYRIVSNDLPNGTTAKVEQIEYDPGRSARIARIKDQNGIYYYILATAGMKVGTKLSASEEASIEAGNRLPLENIPVGSVVHAIELQPGKGSQLVRSAGTGAQLMAKENGWAQIKLPSGEVRLVSVNCTASIGTIGNDQHQNIKIGKAGRTRKKGFRPTVRGVVMNAVDHPHGGGDGGRHRMARAPTTPWGQKTLGFKTRRRKQGRNLILKTRHESKRR